MYSIKADLHTHTIFSGHAYGTLAENVNAAAEAGLEAVAITDHYSEYYNIGVEKDGDLFAQYGHFLNMRAVPKTVRGVRVLSGLEADIVDFQGHILGYDREIRGVRQDVAVMGACDIRIASVHHLKGRKESTVLDNTRLYCAVLENPLVQILGHIGRTGLLFELDAVLNAAKDLHKYVEINEHSLDDIFDGDAGSRCRKIAVRCAELGVGITLGSDAHCSYMVGRFQKAAAMLEEIGFPEKLILNTSWERISERLHME